MTIQYLEYVLALSQTLNFTKAASYMHITQPAFSRIISNVEEELGFTVFERTRRNVQLTPAGKEFVVAVEKALQIYRAGAAQGLKHPLDRKRSLSIGYIPDHFNSDIRDILSRFRKEYPEIEIQLHETSYYEVYEALLNEYLDAAIYTSNMQNLPSKIALRKLESYELYVALYRDHPLASRHELQPWELIGETFVELCYNKMFSRSWNALQYVGKVAGFVPIVSNQVTTLSSCMLQVAAGQGIAVVTKPILNYYGELYREEISFARLEQIEPFVRVIQWADKTENEDVKLFVERISELYQAPETSHYRP